LRGYLTSLSSSLGEPRQLAKHHIELLSLAE